MPATERRSRTFALALLALTAGASAAEPAVVSGHPGWPPFSWQEQDRMVGAGTALVESVLDELKIAYVTRPSGNWKRVQAEARAGEVDVIVAAYRTDERETYLVYAEPAYAEDANVIWVKKGRAFAFDGWDDLIGKRGTVMLGESYGQRFDTFLEQELTIGWVNSPIQNLAKLDLERADYYPFSLFGGQIQIAQLGYRDRIEALPTPISTEGVYLVVSKQSPLTARLPEIQAAIERRRSDGTVDRLVREYVERAERALPPAE